MRNGEFRDVDIELKGDGTVDIHDDAPIITYLQACETSFGLTPKECN